MSCPTTTNGSLLITSIFLTEPLKRRTKKVDTKVTTSQVSNGRVGTPRRWIGCLCQCSLILSWGLQRQIYVIHSLTDRRNWEGTHQLLLLILIDRCTYKRLYIYSRLNLYNLYIHYKYVWYTYRTKSHTSSVLTPN